MGLEVCVSMLVEASVAGDRPGKGVFNTEHTVSMTQSSLVKVIWTSQRAS